MLRFIDTETTGLYHYKGHEVWEIAIIEEDGTEYQWFIEPLYMEKADPKALEIGRYEERMPKRHLDDALQLRTDAAEYIFSLLAGSHIVGANVEFDSDFLFKFLTEELNIDEKPWHYHQIDIEDMMLGYLAAVGVVPTVPFKSVGLLADLGIELNDEDAHTALGDARWVREAWNFMARRAVEVDVAAGEHWS